ncbi:MAG TPA: helix-turn-helix domain-containing protein [Dehalococcoidia bacterium]|nr:helix-turn-helix domain-containing protein [Dehalococcoidia bacterium]
MLTTGDVARILGVHPSTVRRWNNRKLLKGYRIGPQAGRRYRREDVVHFLREESTLKSLRGEIARQC